MTSPTLEGSWTQTAKHARRLQKTMTRKGRFNTVANPNFQVSIHGGTSSRVLEGAQVAGTNIRCKRQQPAGRTTEEQPQWPQRDDGGRGDTYDTAPKCWSSLYFYPSGFPEPSVVFVIHPPPREIHQLLTHLLFKQLFAAFPSKFQTSGRQRALNLN